MSKEEMILESLEDQGFAALVAPDPTVNKLLKTELLKTARRHMPVPYQTPKHFAQAAIDAHEKTYKKIVGLRSRESSSRFDGINRHALQAIDRR